MSPAALPEVSLVWRRVDGRSSVALSLPTAEIVSAIEANPDAPVVHWNGYPLRLVGDPWSGQKMRVESLR